MEANINIDQFLKVCLKVGEVVDVFPVEGSSKLLQFSIDIGGGETRTILSGIANYYATDDLKGRKVIIVSNLEKRKMMGIESNGMILCSSYQRDGKEVVEIVEPPKNSPNGTILS